MARRDISDTTVCQAYAERETAGGFVDEILRRVTNQPEKICNAAMERALSHGLVDYGTSLRGGWLTDKGRDLLKTAQPQN